MPSQALHAIAGEDALLAARFEPFEGVEAKAFALGCQATDVFYHNQRTRPSGLHFGPLSHRKGSGSLFVALARESSGFSEDDRRIAAAYLLGYATHAEVDRVFHPYIISLAGYRTRIAGDDPYAACHPFLERLLDVEFAMLKRGATIADLRLSESLDPGDGPRETIARAYSLALDDVYVHSSDDVKLPDRVRNAFRDARHVFAATDPALTERYRASIERWADTPYALLGASILYPARIPDGLDVLNRRAAAWLDPATGRERRETAVELYELAVERARKSIEAAYPLASALLEGALPDLDSAALARRAIGDASLNLPGPDGVDEKPIACSPLPLKAFLMDHLKELRSSLDVRRG
jgi:hypothetical protein